jgi:phage shock protein PspC (stress-responsive transcriptional regulator)
MPNPEQPGPASAGVNTEHLRDYTHLRRSRTDRKVAGVAGGLGRHLNIDPTILRVLFVALTFFGGAGLLLYVVAWLLVPEEDGATVISTNDRLRNALLISAGVVAGVVMLSEGWAGHGFPWLLIAGVILVAVLVSRDKKENPANAVQQSYPPPYAPQYVAPYAAPSDPTMSMPAGPPPSWYPPAPPVPPVPSRPRRTGPILFGFTLALIALALGILGLYDAAGHSVVDAAYPATALAITGLMLVVGAFYGRPGGLILVGLIASFATVTAGVAQPSFDGDRDQVYRPLSAESVQDSYYVPAGRIELDLTDIVEPEGLDGRSIELSGNIGEIVVIVPRDVEVNVDAQIDYGGQIDIGGRTRDGWGPELSQTLSSTDPAAQLDLELDLHAGHIEVRHP